MFGPRNCITRTKKSSLTTSHFTSNLSSGRARLCRGHSSSCCQITSIGTAYSASLKIQRTRLSIAWSEGRTACYSTDSLRHAAVAGAERRSCLSRAFFDWDRPLNWLGRWHGSLLARITNCVRLLVIPWHTQTVIQCALPRATPSAQMEEGAREKSKEGYFATLTSHPTFLAHLTRKKIDFARAPIVEFL